MPVAVEWRIRCERSGTDSAKALAHRGFGLAGVGIPAVTVAKKPHRAFFKNDTPVIDRLCCVKSHGGNLRSKTSRRKPEMQDGDLINPPLITPDIRFQRVADIQMKNEEIRPFIQLSFGVKERMIYDFPRREGGIGPTPFQFEYNLSANRHSPFW